MSGQSLAQSTVQSPVQTLVRTDRRFRTGRALGWPARSGGALWLGALVLTSLPVFWLGIVSLGAAWATPEYSHGPLIPLISLFLFLRARREGPPRPAPGPLAAWGLQQRLPEPQPLPAMLDLDTRGLGRELARLGRMAPTRALLAALLLGITFSAALLALPRPVPEAPPRAPFALFPADLGAWRGATTRLQPEIEAVLGASDYLATSFHAPGTAAPVALFAAWYHSQTDGQGIHSPEVCLPAGGWEIFEIAARRVALPGHGEIPLNRAVIGKGAERQLVYYWFEARGTRMTSDIAAKLAVLRDGITRGRSDGALVRLVTPILPAEPEGAADARLQALMADLLPVLPDFIPE